MLAWRFLAGLMAAALLVHCAPPGPAQPGGPAPTPTAPPAVTAAATLTPRPKATLPPAGSSAPAPGALEVAWTSTSPDGQWTATAVKANLFEGTDYYVRLRVEDASGQVWTPVDEWRPMGLGYTLPGFLQWSEDSQRLYYTNVPHPDGCSLFVNGGDLHVLELATGEVTQLMPEQALWVAIAPDETRAAYIGYGERGLIVRHLATGQERGFAVPRPAPGAPLGALVWAPDGNALALTAAHEQCRLDGPRSIMLVDLVSGEARALVSDDCRGLTTVGWPEAGELLVEDRAGAQWRLDIPTGVLTPD